MKHYQLVLENRRYVQALERFNAELERRVVERTQQLAGMNQIHQYIATHVFDVSTALTFIIDVISGVLNLDRCVIYLMEEQDRWVARAGLNRNTALSDAELALLPPLSSADVSPVLGSNRVFIGENEGIIQAERASDQDLMSPQDLEMLKNFTEPIRLAIKFARIYENLPTANEGMDVDGILAEVEAYEQKKEATGLADIEDDSREF